MADDPDADIGFVVKPPEGEGGLHTLIDRSGVLLARCRDEASLVTDTASFVRNLAEHHTGAAPFALRVVKTEAGLVASPLWAAVGLAAATTPLARQGATVQPGLRVWLDERGRAASADGGPLTRLVTMNQLGDEAPTGGQMVQALAATATASADRRAALDAALASVQAGLDVVVLNGARPVDVAAAFTR
ncbi:MAG: hypothetical protein GY929_13015 [Actinomycetia bacterium]|nr:hypothetical protein [Actinomycetes bacterium]